MIKNYFKIAFRNLAKNKMYSFINIGGLAVGMAVAMLIGLWIYDELSYEKYNPNYNSIAQVWFNSSHDGQINSYKGNPIPLAEELRTKYGSQFKHVILAWWNLDHNLAAGDEKFTRKGMFMEPEGPDMFAMKMLKGSRTGLADMSSILLSASTAKALFGNADPIDKMMKIDNKWDVKVTGVYEDFPQNSVFNDLTFVAPWSLHYSQNWVKQNINNWGNSSFLIYVQTADHSTIDQASANIKYALRQATPNKEIQTHTLFLHPMSRWHLFPEFKNGVNTGGPVTFVWLFGIIGLFVLLLACINFMNLSTARSEKRAKEVGIRKAIGSMRGQLIKQFFSESLLVAAIAYIISLLLVLLFLPFFNELANKKMAIAWAHPVFWLIGIGFTFITGLIAGSYPALYLSSFQPVKVLKGTFRVGRFASIPRRTLVVLQFTVSIILIIGTIIVFRQIQFAKSRPVGYNREGLITMQLTTGELREHYDAFQNDMTQAGLASSMAESSGPATDIWQNDGGTSWTGKDPNFQADFATVDISHDFGKTMGWEFIQGRDFRRDLATDSAGVVISESAVKYMNLKTPIGETINWNGKNYSVIGVIKDMLMASPYEPVKQTIFYIKGNYSWLTIRLNPELSASQAISKIEAAFKTYAPSAPFDYKFIDHEFAKKFIDEERIGKLATYLTILAIFISCLGLFGLASFVAEQRTKEIGVRKVIGASIVNIWQLLSREFVVLVIVSFLIASPVAYYFMNNWIHHYTYHAPISWWIFIAAGAGALLITILTISFQAIKAAVANPIKSLRTE